VAVDVSGCGAWWGGGLDGSSEGSVGLNDMWRVLVGESGRLREGLAGWVSSVSRSVWGGSCHGKQCEARYSLGVEQVGVVARRVPSGG
jgi:hypothetical protein